MPLSNIFKPGLDAFDKITSGEDYKDIQQAAAKGKSYLSNALNLLLLALIMMAIAIGILVQMLINRPSRDHIASVQKENEYVKTELNKCQLENEQKFNLLISKLRQTESLVNEVQVKADTVYDLAEKNAIKYNTVKKTLVRISNPQK